MTLSPRVGVVSPEGEDTASVVRSAALPLLSPPICLGGNLVKVDIDEETDCDSTRFEAGRSSATEGFVDTESRLGIVNKYPGELTPEKYTVTGAPQT